jgi:uncharacterized protein (TIGR00297 family)
MLAIEIAAVLTATIAGHPLWEAGAATVAFTLLARWMRGVSRSGAVAGLVVCFAMYAGAGRGAFLALVSVFALAWIATRWGYQRKQQLGTAETGEGRTASQVIANLSVAAACAVLHGISVRAIFLLAMTAALSEAAADTVSSEFGQASSQSARLITTWELVPAGTDGAVSWAGTIAGVAAAMAVNTLCTASGLIPWRWLGISVIAAVAGAWADSYMGAWLERRRLLSNDAVNLLGTLIAGGIACLLSLI